MKLKITFMQDELKELTKQDFEIMEQTLKSSKALNRVSFMKTVKTPTRDCWLRHLGINKEER